MTKKELKKELRAKSLPVSGTKAELRERLANSPKGYSRAPETEEIEKLLRDKAHNIYRRQPRSLLRDEKVKELAEEIANI